MSSYIKWAASVDVALKERFDAVDASLAAISSDLRGEPGSDRPGLMERVKHLETIEEGRKWWFRTIAALSLGALVSGVAAIALAV